MVLLFQCLSLLSKTGTWKRQYTTFVSIWNTISAGKLK